MSGLRADGRGGTRSGLEEHLTHALPHQHNRTLEVDRQHVIDCGVAQGREHAIVGHCRIGDTVINPAKSADSCRDEPLQFCTVGCVGKLGMKTRRVVRLKLFQTR